MTASDLKSYIADQLAVPVNQVVKILNSLNSIIDFAAGVNSDVIPDWASGLTFKTDGTLSGKYCKYPDTGGNIRIFETKVDNNTNNAPPTDPSLTENTFWKEISASSSSAIPEWTPGVYSSDLIIVYFSGGLYLLSDPTRPFTSTNISPEITAGQWTLIGGSDKFVGNPTLSLSPGRSFGKYVNGDTPSWDGLTGVQAILDAISEYLNPAFSLFQILTSTGPDIVQSTILEVGTTLPVTLYAKWAIAIGSGAVSLIDVIDVSASSNLLTNTPNDNLQSFSITRQLNANGATQRFKAILHDTNTVQDIPSAEFVITSRFICFYDEVSAFPTNTAGVRALGHSVFISGATTIDLAIGTSLSKSALYIENTYSVTHVEDVNNLGNDITAVYVLTGTMTFVDAGGTNRTYKKYERNPASPDPSNTIHRFTIS